MLGKKDKCHYVQTTLLPSPFSELLLHDILWYGIHIWVAVLSMSPPKLWCRRRERENHDTSQALFSSSQNTSMLWVLVLLPSAVHITVWVALKEFNFTASSQSDLGQIFYFKGRWKEKDNGWELVLRISWIQVVGGFVQNSGGVVWDQVRYFFIGDPKWEAEMAELQNTV